MDEENKTNGEAEPFVEPVAEMPQQNEETDPFAAVDQVDTPESSEAEVPTEEDFSSEQTDFSEPAEEPAEVPVEESTEEPVVESVEEPMVEIDEPVSVPASVGPRSFDMVKPISAQPEVEASGSIKSTEDQKLVEAVALDTSAVKPKKHVAKTIMILIVLVLIASAAGAAYMYRDSVANDAVAQKTADIATLNTCLLYTSDAADDLLCVDLGGRRII